MRLDKLLSNLGVASRAECRRLLRAGRVRVAGECWRDGARNVPEGAEICMDGVPLDTRTVRHLMLNKPAGVLTATEDGKQATVMELLPALYRACGCMPVGRLDKDTTGLLLLTTDGTLAHRLIAPERHVDKVYEAEVEGALEEADIAAFAQGIPLKDFTALPARMEILSAGEDESRARVQVREGKFHQIKRMFGALGHEVTALSRLTFGALSLPEELPPGQYRELTEEELAALRQEAGLAGPEEPEQSEPSEQPEQPERNENA